MMRPHPEPVVITDETAGQAITRCICASDCLIEIRNPDDLHDWAEQFLIRNVRGACHVDHTGGNKAASPVQSLQRFQRAAAPGQHLRGLRRPPELGAAVPFYGRQPDAADVPRIEAPILLHYGELDERVNAGWPAYKAALDANGKTYEAYIYEGANHGFHNDSTPRYDEAAAELAWQRTVDWFRKYL